MPSEIPEIYSRQVIDTNSTADINIKINNLNNNITTGLDDIEIDGISFNCDADKNDQLLYVKVLQSKLNQVMSTNQFLKMELEIAAFSKNEIQRLYTNEKENVGHLNEKIEMLSASFDIENASKNDVNSM